MRRIELDAIRDTLFAAYAMNQDNAALEAQVAALRAERDAAVARCQELALASVQATFGVIGSEDVLWMKMQIIQKAIRLAHDPVAVLDLRLTEMRTQLLSYLKEKGIIHG